MTASLLMALDCWTCEALTQKTLVGTAGLTLAPCAPAAREEELECQTDD